jgi:hypothetical protein
MPFSRWRILFVFDLQFIVACTIALRASLKLFSKLSHLKEIPEFWKGMGTDGNFTKGMLRAVPA